MRPTCMSWLSVALCSAAFGCAEMEDDVGVSDNAAEASENGRSVNSLQLAGVADPVVAGLDKVNRELPIRHVFIEALGER